jgi:hypothetical protein
LAGVKVSRVGSLPPSVSVSLRAIDAQPPYKQVACASRWVEELICSTATPFWLSLKGAPIVTRLNKVTYVGAWLDDSGWQHLLQDVCVQASLKTQKLVDGLRISNFGPLILAANFSDQTIAWMPALPSGVSGVQTVKILLGEEHIPSQGIAIWQIF